MSLIFGVDLENGPVSQTLKVLRVKEPELLNSLKCRLLVHIFSPLPAIVMYAYQKQQQK